MPRDVFKQLTSSEMMKRLGEANMIQTEQGRKPLPKETAGYGFSSAHPKPKFHRRLTKADFYPIPVSDQFVESRSLEQLICGELDWNEFISAMANWCSDPEEYFELWYQYFKDDDLASQIAEKFHEGTSKFASEMASLIPELRDARKDFNQSYRDCHRQLREGDFSNTFRAELSKMKGALPEKFDIDDYFPEILLEFFLEERTSYFSEYMRRILEGRRPKPSDIIDLMQFQYIYQCDLFRCDRSMSNMFKNSTTLPSHKIVPRLEDLPIRIAAFDYEQEKLDD